MPKGRRETTNLKVSYGKVCRDQSAGIVHKYYPDFLIRLKNGITLVLEIKREDTEKERSV
jgi:hypothetical protein